MAEQSNQEPGLSASGPDRSGGFHTHSPSNRPIDSQDNSENGSQNGSSIDAADDSPNDLPDYDRDLGVIEAITYVTRSCPNGRVVAAARGALEAIKTGGAESMKQQVYFVLTAIQGWRGDRAQQVHRSLSRYLDPDDS